jgi:multiple sugar transport system substrate-binding protein
LSCQQCHPANPRVDAKIPEHGFYDGKVAMMVDGQWPVWPSYAPHFQPEPNYGVAPFPPPADNPERTNSVVVEGPVVIIPAGATDRQAAADLLAWMMSPEIVAEEAYTRANLPTSREAAQDSRFQRIPNFGLFIQLLAHPNAKGGVPNQSPG